ncbi:MAG: hypothetical protein WA397_28055, partial [Roseiarcus sp.]
MTRFAAIVLALSLTAGGALAASPEADYLAARDKAIAEVKALENSKASQSAIDAAMDKALADLTKRLKDIVGPVSVKGFSGPGRLNLDTLSGNQVGYGNMDGVAYVDERPTSMNPPRVVITTRSLLTAWLEGKAKDEDKESRLPTDVEAAVRQENFYSGSDVAFAKYADLPVMKPPGADLAVAALGLFRQDIGPFPPDAIVATVVKGDRVFVANIPHTAPIGKIPACEAIWTEASRKADNLQAEYRASGLKNKKLFEEGIQAGDQGDRDARACFNARAPEQSFFAGLTKEAQSLVDRLALSSILTTNTDADRVQASVTEPAKSAAPPVEHVPSPLIVGNAQTPYHAPQTEAELALSNIINL